MRIGYVVAGGVDRPERGRDVPHLVERLRALAGDHDIRVVALRQEPSPARWSRHGIEVVNVGGRPRRVRAAAALYRLHMERRFDLLHAFGMVPQGVVAGGVGRILGVPSVLEAPGGEFASFPELDFGGWRRLAGRGWIASMARWGPVVVHTESQRVLALSRGVRATVIPLGLDEEAWPQRAPAAREEGPLRLAWIGTLNRIKGPERAVQALAATDGATLEMMGEDLLGGAIQRLADRLGVAERVRVHGLLAPEQVRAVLDRSHALLVTSWFEGAGRAILEAAARGLPAVGTAVGHLAEWPEASVTVPPDAPYEALAGVVARLASDEGLRRRLAEAAGRRVALHRMRHVAATWSGFYARVSNSTEAAR
ncbi:MAG: glycosyltransferase family 4 protein [Longimicrobiales bacterium]